MEFGLQYLKKTPNKILPWIYIVSLPFLSVFYFLSVFFFLKGYFMLYFHN